MTRIKTRTKVYDVCVKTKAIGDQDQDEVEYQQPPPMIESSPKLGETLKKSSWILQWFPLTISSLIILILSGQEVVSTNQIV